MKRLIAICRSVKEIFEMERTNKNNSETKSTETIKELKEELFKKDCLLEDCLNNLKRTQKALLMIKDKYDWAYIPTVTEAYKVHTTPFFMEEFTENERHSWEYVMGYEEIMFLINVASDYCFKAEKKITQEVC